jgi:GNAT superfamily N-acetyltransferase
LLASLNQVGEGFTPGFVWVEDRKIVGNVSIRRADARGEGWLIGNVAVHPDYRRRGIALALMQAAVGLLPERGGRWAGLLVEHDNDAAIRLYEHMGFNRLGAVTTWQRRLAQARPAVPPDTQPVAIRRRRGDEWEAEYRLARSARPAQLTWLEPITRKDFSAGWLTGIGNLFSGKREEHWVVAEGERLVGALRVTASWAGNAHEMAIFVQPQSRGRLEAALLAHGLARLPRSARPVQVEHPAGDIDAETALRDLGFAPVRTLVHMKLDR